MDFLKKIFQPKSPSPQTADEYFERGKSEALSGNYRDSIVDLNKALALNPGHMNALLERGKAKTEMKDYKGAIADYSKSLALNPSNATAFQKRATAKDRLKDYRGAIEDLDAATKLSPDFATAFYERGLIKIMAMKDKKGGQADLNRAGELGLALAYDALRQFFGD